ncbi:MAG TPA: peptidylprolyl isomerase [Tahibacter sp.]|uniref:peptidylprolyl isomerase n=1 Tax=Tahibacter sp. TaxID=2056211 RepID=UPI002B61DB52|nr:peptidylprolyl isomerase [Tahibacter sp.]HSX61234.1 peptidylprolyl isomerase [Tahibacter sp.]
MHRRSLGAAVAACLLSVTFASPAAEAPPKKGRTMTEVLAASQPSDWRRLDPDDTVYLDFSAGRVVIELAPAYAPAHVANIRTLLKQHYFDGLAILRVHDNYVVQWGDPESGDKDKARPFGEARRSVPGEFSQAIAKQPFVRLPDGDVYAPEVGWSGGFPVARDPKAGQTWLAHCYGMVGVGRDNAADSGNGSELYVVLGHAPRHLDRNVTLVGRVVQGMELLAALPRGTGPLGFYEKAEQRVPLTRVRLGSDVPEDQRSSLELLRTDTETFTALVETRRNRHDEWYLSQAGKVEVCNVALPVRQAGKKR